MFEKHLRKSDILSKDTPKYHKRIQNQVKHPRWTIFIPELLPLFISTFLFLLMFSENCMDGVYIVVMKK